MVVSVFSLGKFMGTCWGNVLVAKMKLINWNVQPIFPVARYLRCIVDTCLGHRKCPNNMHCCTIPGCNLH